VGATRKKKCSEVYSKEPPIIFYLEPDEFISNPLVLLKYCDRFTARQI
jgi:hypothetical protein